MQELLFVARYADFDAALLDALSVALPAERLERALRAKNAETRAGLILGYALLRYGAERLLGHKELPTLSYGSCGKPYFPNTPIAFSISHSKLAVAVLFSASHTEIGLDLEELRALRPTLIRRYASDAELAKIRSDRDAILLWTKKEAAAKKSGMGLKGDLRGIDTRDTASLFFNLGDTEAALSVAPATVLTPDLVPTFLLPSNLL